MGRVGYTEVEVKAWKSRTGESDCIHECICVQCDQCEGEDEVKRGWTDVLVHGWDRWGWIGVGITHMHLSEVRGERHGAEQSQRK